MATKTINTRIVLTHDEYSALSDKVLKAGEVVLAKVGTTEANGKVSEPIWMMKVGDGNSTVAACPWLVAPAADVHEWAKKAALDANDLPAIPGDKLGITVTVTGEGNAITNASWDATTKTLTLTKGETFATKAEFDAHTQDTEAHKDTTYEAGTKLELDGTTFNHTATTRTDTADAADATFGGTIEIVDSVSSDETGHITAINKKTITLPTPDEVVLPTVEDTEVAGQVVVEVDQTAGAIDVKRKALEVVHEDGQIYLTIGGTKIGTGFSDADFIKDGFLSKVEKDTTTNEIVFTWNTDAGLTETRIDIDELVEVYTAGDGIEVEDYVNSHAKPATVATNVTKTDRTYISGIEFDEFGHVTKVETGVETDQDLTHNHDDEYKKLQTAVETVGAANKTLQISQDAQGVITATPVDIAITADQVTDLDVGVTKVTTTANNGLKVTPVAGTGDVTIDIDDTIVFVLDGGTSARLG